MQDSNHKRRRRATRKLQPLPNNNLPAQRHRKHDAKEANADRPNHQPPQAHPQRAALLLGEQELQRRHDADEATAQRHGADGAGNRLHEHVLDGPEREGQQAARGAEPSEPQQRARHRHARHPARLQPEVRVAEADYDPNREAHQHAARREVVLLGGPRRGVRR